MARGPWLGGVTVNLRIVIAQLDFFVGDVEGNAGRVLAATATAREELGAHAVVFPELALAGYPPDDLILRPDFLAAVETALKALADQAHGIDVIVGFPERHDGLPFNSAAVLREGAIHTIYRKPRRPVSYTHLTLPTN